MAALNADQIQVAFSDGICDKTVLYSLKNVTAADTVDMNAQFKVVKRAGVVSATGTTIASVTITSNTVGTIPTGPANDGVWLLAYGVAV